MARSKRVPYFAPSVDRTLERVAIAALAAITTRGEVQSVAVAALTIFVIVAVIEELGRGWVWRGKRETLSDLAYRYFRKRMFQRHDARRDYRRRQKGYPARKGNRAAVARSSHSAGRKV